MNPTLKWGSIVPLIGGFTVGSKLATNQDPDFILSYGAFGDNDALCKNYFNQVPFQLIDDEETLPSPEIYSAIDFINTTCPCAGLSMMNASASRGANAPQNQWMFKTANFVLENLRPRVFFGENAPGLYTNLGKEVADKLYEIGKANGYSFSMIRTNTALHGIPQRRVRTFYFFWDSATAPIMNWYQRESNHWLDYLREIPFDASLQEGVSDKTVDVSYQYLKSKLPAEKLFINRSTVEIILSEGLFDDYVNFLESKGLEDDAKKIGYIKAKLDMGKGFWNSFPHLLDKNDAISGPVTGRSMDRIIHPTEQRTFTYREYMHLMGLPHDFQLIDPKKDLNKIAQNVPTCTARDMTLEVMKYLNGELKLSESDYLRQDNTTQKTEIPKVIPKATPVF